MMVLPGDPWAIFRPLPYDLYDPLLLRDQGAFVNDTYGIPRN